jgi:hypothetical protein
LKNYRDSQWEQLETYGWVDKEGGVVRIPIERAMDLVLERGLAAEKPVGGAKPLSK